MAVRLLARLYLRVGHDECSLVSFVSLEEEIKGISSRWSMQVFRVNMGSRVTNEPESRRAETPGEDRHKQAFLQPDSSSNASTW